jgi:tRNA G18 (ribose-2'-O)-methylase SpoU
MKTQLILETFDPRRCVYLLGAEDMGYQKAAIAKCHYLVKIQMEKSLNVSVAGSIVLYDQL